MYNISRPPSKFASKAPRRVIGVALEKIEGRESNRREPAGQANMSSPRPVFNGKKSQMTSPEVEVTPHEENVKFVSDAWLKVWRDYEAHLHKRDEGGPILYQEKTPVESKEFEPVDLDQWYRDRNPQNATQSP